MRGRRKLCYHSRRASGFEKSEREGKEPLFAKLFISRAGFEFRIRSDFVSFFLCFATSRLYEILRVWRREFLQNNRLSSLEYELFDSEYRFYEHHLTSQEKHHYFATEKGKQ